MLHALSLVLPVLIPSWRFFETIEPSPRVQYKRPIDTDWHDFQPCPKTLAPPQYLFRLFWNPDRNDALFVTSCAERIQQQPTEHSIDEIKRRIQTLLDPGDPFQFRLVFIHHDGDRLVQETVFTSDIFAC